MTLRPQTGTGSPPSSLPAGGGGALLPTGSRMGALRQAIRTLEASLPGDAGGAVPLGIPAIDAALGGGLARGALHEIAAARESDVAAATGFALAAATLAREASGPGRLMVRDVSKDERAKTARGVVVWIAEDMALVESGAPYGPGLDASGLHPERLIVAAAARAREVLWAMEEALRCRAVCAVIGEVRGARIDLVATRRLSLAAAGTGALALLLRNAPGADASAAATRWTVGAARAGTTTHGVGPPRFALRLARNRRGHLGAWIVESDRVEQRLILAPTDPEPVAVAARDRPDRKVA
jgi:protein ImuA